MARVHRLAFFVFSLILTLCLDSAVSVSVLSAAYDWLIGSTNADDLHVGNRLRNRLNIFRQPVEFGIDIAIPFDVSNFGTGALAHVPILTAIVGLASFFFILGVLATPFVAVMDKTTKYWIQREKRSVRDEEEDAERRFGSGDSFFAKFRRVREAEWDADHGFTWLGLTKDEARRTNGTDRETTEKREELECRRFLLCEIHRYFNVLPDWALKIVTFFG
jgi:hypothetical protein